MKAVTTIQFGWSGKALVQRRVATWITAHPALWLLARTGYWLLRKPTLVMGLAVGLWMTSLGLPVIAAIALGGTLPLAWAGRTWYRVLSPLTGTEGDKSSSTTITPSVYVRVKKNLGNIAASIRRWRVLKRSWPVAAFNAGLVSKQDREQVPELAGVHRTNSGLAATINCGAVGVPADQVANKSDVLAASLRGCRSVLVVPGLSPGIANLHFMWADPLAEILDLSQLPPSPSSSRLSFGITEDGQPATIAKIKSLLVIGQSGSGKSNALWALLASALADGVPFKLHVVDPAGGVELHVLKSSPLVRTYAGRVKDTVKLISNAHAAMEERLTRMSGKTRLHKPTNREPWEIILIDEMLLLKDMLPKGAVNQLNDILSVGRKAAFTVWALSQLSAVEDIGRYRKLFVQKLVLATDSRQMTDNVLGDGAEHAGALCSKIRESTPGIGYASLEGTHGFPRFRVAWIPDEVTHMIARGIVPSYMPVREISTGDADLENQQHVMYGWYEPGGDTEDDELVYVGITNRGARRAHEHMSDKEWAQKPGVYCVVLEQFDTRSEALTAERERIERVRPKYNKQHNPDYEGGVLYDSKPGAH